MRRLNAAALTLLLSWGWISPPQASAQLLPPLPGGLVVTTRVYEQVQLELATGHAVTASGWAAAYPFAGRGSL